MAFSNILNEDIHSLNPSDSFQLSKKKKRTVSLINCMQIDFYDLFVLRGSRVE